MRIFLNNTFALKLFALVLSILLRVIDGLQTILSYEAENFVQEQATAALADANELDTYTNFIYCMFKDVVYDYDSLKFRVLFYRQCILAGRIFSRVVDIVNRKLDKYKHTPFSNTDTINKLTHLQHVLFTTNKVFDRLTYRANNNVFVIRWMIMFPIMLVVRLALSPLLEKPKLNKLKEPELLNSLNEPFRFQKRKRVYRTILQLTQISGFYKSSYFKQHVQLSQVFNKASVLGENESSHLLIAHSPELLFLINEASKKTVFETSPIDVLDDEMPHRLNGLGKLLPQSKPMWSQPNNLKKQVRPETLNVQEVTSSSRPKDQFSTELPNGDKENSTQSEQRPKRLYKSDCKDIFAKVGFYNKDNFKTLHIKTNNLLTRFERIYQAEAYAKKAKAEGLKQLPERNKGRKVDGIPKKFCSDLVPKGVYECLPEGELPLDYDTLSWLSGFVDMTEDKMKKDEELGLSGLMEHQESEEVKSIMVNYSGTKTYHSLKPHPALSQELKNEYLAATEDTERMKKQTCVPEVSNLLVVRFHYDKPNGIEVRFKDQALDDPKVAKALERYNIRLFVQKVEEIEQESFKEADLHKEDYENASFLCIEIENKKTEKNYKLAFPEALRSASYYYEKVATGAIA
ncbi:hypothetical protein SJAG_03800 [Schizosaccharomyces japonicus yFS275]|uniref:Uncharacterized protein n=1 Tax=Schizosaccharomyces japonicus (strain yFS275 / FY16936) TaxID=402676 RepID=B6K534_SCHJY|nr:hypothetical protein SJAG_03800 [Schizosaccharomyces japonicus yFS275]EEB08638.1 hypothetical protein SJAG_03800 [Schizosaccharomyces japonicus yFS275]